MFGNIACGVIFNHFIIIIISYLQCICFMINISGGSKGGGGVKNSKNRMGPVWHILLGPTLN